MGIKRGLPCIVNSIWFFT